MHTGTYQCGRFTVTFAPESGAIVSLVDALTGVEWAGPSNPIALPAYQTLTEFDFAEFLSAYSLCQDVNAECAGGLRSVLKSVHFSGCSQSLGLWKAVVASDGEPPASVYSTYTKRPLHAKYDKLNDFPPLLLVC